MSTSLQKWLRASGLSTGKSKPIDVKVSEPYNINEDRRSHKRERAYRQRNNAEKVSNRLTLSGLPTFHDDKDSYGSLLNVHGIVVPMGHGKTTLAKEEGWIDVDSLLQPKMLRDLSEEVGDRIMEGQSVDEASLICARPLGQAIRLLNPHEDVILMAQSYGLLESIGVRCIGSVAIRPDIVKEANKHRDVHELLMIEKNIEEVIELSDKYGVTVYPGDSMNDVRWYIYNICQHFSIPITRPKMFDMDECTIRDDKYGSNETIDLDVVIDDHTRGKIPREVVNSQIKKHGLRSYMGFGFTWNDWAKVISYAEQTRGGPAFDDADWTGWPINLHNLSEGINFDEHDDLKMILKAHSGEHERFVLTIILHWKLIGSQLPIAKKVFPLYLIRRVHWTGVFDQIRDGVLSSNTFVNMPLTMEERESILSMRMLSAGSIKQIKSLMETQGGAYPRSIPHKNTSIKIEAALLRTKFSVSNQDAKEIEFKELVNANPLTMGSISWSEELTIREQIVKSLGMELCDRWRTEPDYRSKVGRVLKNIITRWYRACIIRDEWSDMAVKLLEARSTGQDLSHAIASMLSCDVESGLSGVDWSIRVIECFKGFMVCALICDKDGVIVMQESRGGVRPCILGLEESEIWSRIAARNIPKNALGCFSNGVSYLQKIMEMAVWSQNKTLVLMEMINVKSWIPKITDRMILSCVCRWKDHFDRYEEKYILNKILDKYTKKILGRSLESIEERLDRLRVIRKEDGGLGCGKALFRGTMEKRNGLWTGKGDIKVDRASTHVQKPKGIKELLARYENDDGTKATRLDVNSMYNIGPAMSLLIKEEGKHSIKEHSELLIELNLCKLTH